MAKLPLDVTTVQNIDPDLKKLLTELVNKQLKYEALRFYSGKVVDNNDPERLGRCRIRVFGVYGDEIDNMELPWALPDDKFVGSFKGSLIIPPKDALVRVYFDKGDIYAPVYTTKIPEKRYKSENIKTDYPDTMLFFETDNGDYFTINRKKSEVTFHAAGGALITIDSKGNIVIDTGEADKIYGGGFKIEVNGDVNLKSIGDITIDAVGTPTNAIPLINPFEIPDPTDVPRVPSTSRLNLDATGEANIITLNNPAPPTNPDPIPDPTDPVQVQLAAIRKLKSPTASINIIAAKADISLLAVAGSIKAKSSIGVEITAPVVDVVGGQVNLGKGATDALIKSNALASFYDSHTHPTPSGPSGPPIVPMTPQLVTLVSPISKTA